MKTLQKHNTFSRLVIVAAVGCLFSCGNTQTQHMKNKKDTYGYAVEFFRDQQIATIELTQDDARLLLVPGYQGRVMTTSSQGMEGKSYGWINYDFIRSGIRDDQFNVYGGEERFWLGPEGGPYSWYFAPGEEQVYDNWRVPPVIDTEPFQTVEYDSRKASFRRQASLANASGYWFDMQIDRTVRLLSPSEVAGRLGIDLPAGLRQVAYCTENSLTNTGELAWDRTTGMPCVWLLCMFNPNPGTTIFVPYDTNTNPDIPIVNDTYFGQVPSDRLIDNGEGMLFFRIDGKQRGKIGIPAGRACPILGSYDASQQMLTLLEYTLPEGECDYMNGIWGNDDPLRGDVINCYNDGPLEDGSIMGPFYEIESSSPGAALLPGQTLSHSQVIYHLEADEAVLDKIVTALFHVPLEKIRTAF